ncbi:MAG: TatD family hydrolase, partial [Proteobacteria bacterium]|nr:TatD family hydrolase [Pseudomonadota bacterium]
MDVIEISDSHCHLDFKDFKDDLDGIVQRALVAGVSKMITICTKLIDEPKVRLLAEKYKSVYYAAGTHPMSAA